MKVNLVCVKIFKIPRLRFNGAVMKKNKADKPGQIRGIASSNPPSSRKIEVTDWMWGRESER